MTSAPTTQHVTDILMICVAHRDEAVMLIDGNGCAAHVAG
jgi:hypothetical protein